MRRASIVSSPDRPLPSFGFGTHIDHARRPGTKDRAAEIVHEATGDDDWPTGSQPCRAGARLRSAFDKSGFALSGDGHLLLHRGDNDRCDRGGRGTGHDAGKAEISRGDGNDGAKVQRRCVALQTGDRRECPACHAKTLFKNRCKY